VWWDSSHTIEHGIHAYNAFLFYPGAAEDEGMDSIWKRAIPGAVFLGVVGTIWWFLPAALSGDAAGPLLSGPWAPALFVALYAAATVAGFPGSVLTVTAGAAFGAVAGALWSLIGATLGAVAAFLVSRRLLSRWARDRSGKLLARVIDGVDASGWRFVALLRLVPLVPFNAVNYALGLTRIGIIPYTLATLVCMAPATLACALIGQGGIEASRGEDGALRPILLGLMVLAGIALLPGAWRRFAGASRQPGRSLVAMHGLERRHA
jgi:uncharacterized membrane protein YdjX (TVP38/TMEM64 family)